MKKVIMLFLLLGLMSCSSDTWLPMSSFSINVNSNTQSKEVWNKLRVIILKRGYSFQDQSKSSKSYVLGSKEPITIMLSDNTAKGFIEVVYFQSIDDGFNDFAENEFNEFMTDVSTALSTNSINVNIPFVKGKAPAGLYK